MDQETKPAFRPVLSKMHCLKKKTPSLKNPAPSSPTPPNSYETRLASYTSWPHTRPEASDMAKAGFHRVAEPTWDRTGCSECGLQVWNWYEDDDPLREHRLRSPECPLLRDLRAQEKPVSKSTPTSPVGGATGSVPPEPASTLIETPHTQATATAAEVSVSDRPSTPPSTDRSIPPPSQHILCSRCGKKSDNALAKADDLPESTEDLTLDTEDWVKFYLDGEDKDEWIKV